VTLHMNRMARRALLAVAMLTTGACAGYMVEGVDVVFVQRQPPPPRREVIIAAPGPGYVWVGGRWAWRSNDYVWVPGAWVVVEAGHRHWEPGRWRHDRRGWFWVEGHWR
jgi:hypothetical protein